MLILHVGALGDFVLTWPLAMALGRLYAQSRIIYVTHGQKGALAERALRVESADVEGGGWHRLFGAAPELPEPALRLIRGAHSIVTFVARGQEGGRDATLANLRALAPEAELVPLDPRPPEDYRGHFTDYLIEQLGAWPAIQASTIAMRRALAERGIAASSTSQPPGGGPVVVHPGSGGQSKCWAAERFLELIDQLRRDGLRVRVILGEVELERWPAPQIERFRKAAEVVVPPTLVALHEELCAASAAVVNDSGPAHLSAISGTPTVVLFGPSNPTIWQPLGPRVAVIQHDLESLQPSTVFDTLAQLHRGAAHA